jgi:hypothetical protein
MHPIIWKGPWNPIQSGAEALGLQSELDKEVSPRHALWGTSPKVIGRRMDNDDVLVRVDDGRLACVHLLWNGRIDQFPDKYPWTVFYASAAEFQSEMEQDAADYGQEP